MFVFVSAEKKSGILNVSEPAVKTYFYTCEFIKS